MTSGAWGTTALGPLSAGSDETSYVRFLIRLLRGVVALIVAGFIIGGTQFGWETFRPGEEVTEVV